MREIFKQEIGAPLHVLRCLGEVAMLHLGEILRDCDPANVLYGEDDD